MKDFHGLVSTSRGIASKDSEIREELEEWREMDLMSEASSEILRRDDLLIKMFGG